MTSRQAGRRISTIAAERRMRARRRGGARQAVRRKNEPMGPRERLHLIQLVACGGIFVLLVAVKLLLPGKMAQVGQLLSGPMGQNVDVQAVFSAVGRAFAGESDVGGAARDVYRAVFHPEEPGEALETAALERLPEASALDTLRTYREESETEEARSGGDPEPADGEGEEEISNLAYVLYSDQNLPRNVSLEQTLL